MSDVDSFDAFVRVYQIYVGEKYVIGLIISIQLMCSEVLHSKFSS